MKSANQYADELQVLEREAASCLSLVTAIPSLRILAQRATTNNIIGQATVAEVVQAQSNLDEAIAALSRKDALAVAIGETQNALSWQQGVERRQVCEGISAEYQEAYDRYIQLCNETLALFRKMQAISNRYNAMTGRTLIDQYQTDLHLPALHGPNDLMKTNIPTGRR